MNKKAELFLTFGKIGLFTFGGGYAMIPLIQKEVVENKKWMSNDDLLDLVAIAESTPGPIAVNAATFIGNKVAGFFGAACATCGVVLPSFLIIVIISYVFEAFKELKAVKYAFWGIRAGVLALILNALWTLFRQAKKDVISIAIMLLSFLAVVIFGVNAIIVIVSAALLGIVSSRIRRDEK
ncbi:MAG: chromate transporter [Lachnospiraceae bacterium]|nr:chromate transporter [Lachnospiraceae bacterium]